MHILERIRADCFDRLVTEIFPSLAARKNDGARLIEDQDEIGGVVDKVAKVLLAPAQFLLRSLVCRDIACDAHRTSDLAACASHRPVPGLDGAPGDPDGFPKRLSCQRASQLPDHDAVSGGRVGHVTSHQFTRLKAQDLKSATFCDRDHAVAAHRDYGGRRAVRGRPKRRRRRMAGVSSAGFERRRTGALIVRAHTALDLSKNLPDHPEEEFPLPKSNVDAKRARMIRPDGGTNCCARTHFGGSVTGRVSVSQLGRYGTRRPRPDGRSPSEDLPGLARASVPHAFGLSNDRSWSRAAQMRPALRVNLSPRTLGRSRIRIPYPPWG